ncbi:PAS domain S-box-containing protein (fragment) [Burkholderia sp. 8Y]
MVQIVTNLLNNAAKYTPDGGLIQLTIDRLDGEVVLRVKDNGVGMEPELMARAFDLFQQGERTPARTEGGLGLGLALVRSLVEQHEGRVTVSSEGPGKGSELIVRLPLATGRPASEVSADAREAPPPSLAPRRHVLVVDDNVDVAASLCTVLEILGHDVVVVHEARSAIGRAKRETFDRCILDIGLPDMTGYELARELKNLPGTRDAVFVAHTGYGQKEDKRLSLEAGFAHHLVKPAAIPDLERVLADSRA